MLACLILLSAVERDRLFGLSIGFFPMPWLDRMLLSERTAIHNRFQVIAGVIGAVMFTALSLLITAHARAQASIAVIPIVSALVVGIYSFCDEWSWWSRYASYGIDRRATATGLAVEVTVLAVASVLWFLSVRTKSTRFAIASCWVGVWSLANIAGEGLFGNTM